MKKLRQWFDEKCLKKSFDDSIFDFYFQMRLLSHCSKMALLTTCRACVSGCDFQKNYDQGVSEQVLFNS